MLKRFLVTRLVPVAASVAIHAALVGSASLLGAWTASRESSVLLELVEPEPPPAPVTAPRDPRPLTPPKPIVRPAPAPPMDKPKPVMPPVESPAPRAQAPAPQAARPAPPAPVTPAPNAQAPAVSPPSSSHAATAPGRTSETSTFAWADPASATAPAAGPAVAGLPPGGIIQPAIPRGGYQYRPDYPASARHRNIQGTTLLDVLVTDDGRVADVVVKESAGHPDLDRAAADAVRRWRFEPARRGTEAVAMRVLLPVVFRLR